MRPAHTCCVEHGTSAAPRGDTNGHRDLPPTKMDTLGGVGSQVMAMKDLFRELQPLPLYAMLALTVLFFAAELVVSHVTHALTLLVDSYHTLCNLIALTGCLITVKYGRSSMRVHSPRGSCSGEEELVSQAKGLKGCASDCQQRGGQGISSERRLRNTFGWARIEVLVMLIGTVFLASLCFSLVVEAVQTLFHIGHSDEMHHPIPVMLVGATGLLLNGLCYLLIGGYTFHQGSFLHVTASGDVVLDRALSDDAMRKGGRRLSTRRQVAADAEICATEDPPSSPAHLHTPVMRQGPREMLRDVVGCVFVIVCSIVVYFTEQGVAKYVDPILSIVSALLLLLLSIPYMKESGRILLQTIPDYIDIESLKSELVRAFPSLVNVHEVHIWCLTPTRVFATAHLVLRSHQDYVQIKEALADFFHEHGITQATIQPEFFKASEGDEPEPECFLQCRGEGCLQRHCCQSTPTSSQEDLQVVACIGAAHGHSHGGHGHSHGGGHKHAKQHRRQVGSGKENTVHPTKKQQPEASAPQQQCPEVTVVTSEPCKDDLEVTVSTSEPCKESRRQRKRSQSESMDHESVSSSCARDSVNLENYGITRVKQQSLSEGLDQISRDTGLRQTK